MSAEPVVAGPWVPAHNDKRRVSVGPKGKAFWRATPNDQATYATVRPSPVLHEPSRWEHTDYNCTPDTDGEFDEEGYADAMAVWQTLQKEWQPYHWSVRLPPYWLEGYAPDLEAAKAKADEALELHGVLRFNGELP